MLVAVTGLAQDNIVDTTKVAPALDSLGEVSTLAPVLQDSSRTVTRAKFSGLGDSLLVLIFRNYINNPDYPDRPQSSSDWQVEPMLYRSSTSMWGDFESFNPLGLSLSHLSRVDNLVGEQSFANPVPLPYSEEFLRNEPADRYYFLTPALSGLVLPLGRSTTIYQQTDLADFDTATSSIDVNRGRGGFANTVVDFKSKFGNFGSIRADGTFQKLDGVIFASDTKLNRMRFIVEPRLSARLRGNILYSFNRLKGNRSYFPDDYSLSGYVTDNLATLSSSVTYMRSKESQVDLRLSYRNDDQRFSDTDLRTSQRYRIFESAFEYQKQAGTSVTVLSGTARFLQFRCQGDAQSAIHYTAGLWQLRTMSPRLKVFGTASIAGSDDLAPGPSITSGAIVRVGNNNSVSAIVSRRVIFPQPEMVLLHPISAALTDSIIDYSITGDEDLGSGKSHSVELLLDHKMVGLNLQLMLGIIRFSDIAEWQVNADSLLYGEIRPVAKDQSVAYASVKGSAQPFERVYTTFGYGIRRVQDAGANLTSGPLHTANCAVWYRFPFNRFKVWLSVGAGANFRSAINRSLFGGVDNGVAIAETYSSFDLKRFHFYFNFHNVTNVKYTMNGLEQPGRSVWWGFKWSFID